MLRGALRVVRIRTSITTSREPMPRISIRQSATKWDGGRGSAGEGVGRDWSGDASSMSMSSAEHACRKGWADSDATWGSACGENSHFHHHVQIAHAQQHRKKPQTLVYNVGWGNGGRRGRGLEEAGGGRILVDVDELGGTCLSQRVG